MNLWRNLNSGKTHKETTINTFYFNAKCFVCHIQKTQPILQRLKWPFSRSFTFGKQRYEVQNLALQKYSHLPDKAAIYFYYFLRIEIFKNINIIIAINILQNSL